METIEIEVPDETAKNWKAVPANIRVRISDEFKERIDLEAKHIKNQEIFKLMDEIAQ
jgi:mRNA-degrading endonuclease RelE of RelBE toxin-antitoxin system